MALNRQQYKGEKHNLFMSKISEKTEKIVCDEILRILYEGYPPTYYEKHRRRPNKGITVRFIAETLGRDKELIKRLLEKVKNQHPQLLEKKSGYSKWGVWNLTPQARLKYKDLI
jgi:hypothetical protein